MSAKLPDILFENLTSPEIGEAAKAGALILIPLGQVEEHGDHLPVSTDLALARAITLEAARRLAAEMPVLKMPSLWAGYSGKVMWDWPGTIRVRSRVMLDLLGDIFDSLVASGFRRLIVVSSHGHHFEIGRLAIRELADRHPGVNAAFADIAALGKESFQAGRKSAPGGAIHGCEFETSLMLALDAPVHMERATSEDVMRYHSEFIAGDNFSGGNKVFWSTWGLQRSQTGIYGDPVPSTRELGQKVFEGIVENLVRFAREYVGKTPAS